MIEHILDIISPHRCCSCGEIGDILCSNCKYDIISEPLSVCALCLKPVAKIGLCGSCQRKMPFEQVWFVGERSEALKKLIDQYKFQSSRAGAAVLAELLDEILPILPAGTALTGIPTSPSTVRVRGFDHVGLIVRELARRRNLSVTSLLERKTHATLHFLKKSDREKLGPELFRLNSKVMPKSVLLVDDILTTGTTLRSAGKLLKEAGVEHLYGVVVARQPLN